MRLMGVNLDYMLKIYSLFFFLIVCFQAKSTPNNSEIYFRLHNGDSFTISVDDKLYATPCNNFRMSNVFPGSHYLKVNKIMPVDPLVPISHTGFIEIPPSSRVYLLLDPNNQIRITNIAPIYTSNPGFSNFYTYPTGHSFYSESVNFQQITPEEFDIVKKDFKEIGSDFNRLSAAKHLIYNSRLTSEQVGDLMLLFSFDKDRLSLAKYAYVFTSDPRNYNQVAKNFIFTGSAQELWYYLGNNYRYRYQY